MRRAGGAHRPRPQGADQQALACSTARTISIPTCRRATRSRQYKQPIVGEGEVESICRRQTIEVGIERLHLEQDAGKSIHDQHPDDELRRSQPLGRGADGDRLASPTCARRKRRKAYLTKLRAILRYLGTCDGNMEKGNLRADVNVSVRKPGGELGTRCEIKNVNSIRFIGRRSSTRRAARSTSSRMAARSTRRRGCSTRDKGETRSMRSKEEAHDYRYFPDPDLLPLEKP
jgi:aspartyl-tRNA(Asn)/glutamyl-tRNA(Gln) amidotransferase subunit B